MPIVRIDIKKHLVDVRYAYRKSDVEPFTSEYLVRTDAPFPSEQLKEYATALAVVESHLYPSFIEFQAARVQLVDLNAGPNDLLRSLPKITFNNLRGAFNIAEDDVLAPTQVVAVYKRSPTAGRPGELSLKHALTSKEFSHYQLHRMIPERFLGNGVMCERPKHHYGAQLIEAVRAEGGVHIMKQAYTGRPVAYPEIEEFSFDGFRVKKETPKRKTAAQKRKDAVRGTVLAVQKRFDELGEDAQRVKAAVESLIPASE